MQFSFRMPVAVQILLCIAKFDGVFKTTSTFLPIRPAEFGGSFNQKNAINSETLIMFTKRV